MKCARVGGCLKELTKDWTHPVECVCEIHEKLDANQKRRDNAIARRQHLSDVEFVNQNGRGK